MLFCRDLGVASLSGLTASELMSCDMLEGLVLPQQLKMCEENLATMPYVGLGAHQGLVECRYQFKYERWNCSTTPVNQSTAFVDTLIQLGMLLFSSLSLGFTLYSADTSWHGLPSQSQLLFRLYFI